MERTLSFEEFYRKRNGLSKTTPIPVKEPFNVYLAEDYVGTARAMPYSRRDYYKISMVSGPSKIHYADKTLSVEQNMLLFGNPTIPYNWEMTPSGKTGFFCVFTEAFFKGFGNIKEYPLFQPSGIPILDISAAEMAGLSQIYQRMFAEVASEYPYKYDLLRTLTMELIHAAMKLRPAKLQNIRQHDYSAAARISDLFWTLLERQFPIESTAQRMHLRSPGDFAESLNVHTNHLNKVLKQTFGKTTSQVLADRIALEARAMLKHTDWHIAQIGYCLGFDDPSHFVKFFKKHTRETPTGYREV
jgi:AraC-like DNA-binding protein